MIPRNRLVVSRGERSPETHNPLPAPGEDSLSVTTRADRGTDARLRRHDRSRFQNFASVRKHNSAPASAGRGTISSDAGPVAGAGLSQDLGNVWSI